MSSEIDKLLNELRTMKSESAAKSVVNSRDTWNMIAEGKWKELGFSSEDELSAWIDENPYANL